MKNYLFTALFFFTTLLAVAQPGKKNSSKETPPTQKEMEDMMKEAQREMEKMNPEDKKMMDSLGIKMPALNNIPKVSDQQLAEAWENETRIVPKKDDARIASIQKAPLSGSTVATFIKALHAKIATGLMPASKTLAEKIYTQLKSTGKSSTAIGNSAVGLWMMGRIEPALYIIGRACMDDMGNTDNLCNYAAMTSMCGGQELAIPVLNYLNTKYSRNSTILNNLGQAWFGLGDMQKAEKYLDSTIRIYAYHPQATYTKSFIEENKGNKTGAVELVKKSVSRSYSKEKEERLRKLDYKLAAKDVSLPAKTKADPFNLGGFKHPGFPKSVDECIAMKPVWESFIQDLAKQRAALSKRLEETLKIAAEMQQKRTNTDLNMVKASVAAGSPQGMLTSVPMYADRAYLKQREVSDDYARKTKVFMEKAVLFGQGKAAQLSREYDETMNKLREEDAEQTGEGLPNKDYCPRYKEASDKLLKALNTESELLFNEQLGIDKNFLNDVTYWKMYSEWPEKFEAHKLEAKISWLDKLSNAAKAFKSITEYKCKAKEEKSKGNTLAEFDDVACQYHSELKLPLGKMTFDCSRFTTELDLSVVKLGLKQDMDKDNFMDQFMSCNIEIGFKKGVDIGGELGPLKIQAEASVGGRIGAEFDRTGLKDLYLVGGAGVSVGTGIISDAGKQTTTGSSKAGVGISDLSIDAGVEGRISVISGKSDFYGTGIFQKK